MVSEWTPSKIVGVIGYGIVGVCLVILFWQNSRQDAFDARRAIDIANARAATVHCIQRALAESNESTNARSEAASQRDEAELAKERAMSVIIEQRIQDGRITSVEIQDAARQWQAQFRKFERESVELQAVRRDNPVPDVEKRCG